jgi:hypothetical protein
MSAEALTTKYITNMEKTLKVMQNTRGVIAVSAETVDEILGYVDAYLQDAKYFLEQKQFETSLTSIAYCEGLFDALKLMGAAKLPQQP